ncbi:MAG TPA: metalloregulator ArsR/SmtB family transcription factor [Terriglobales bacterium]|nr:metalloregulator ArsR/SmtB family transcription factor [Terriglobales bacterium]
MIQPVVVLFNPMVEYSRAQPSADHLSGVFAAIADPTRRAMLQMLARKPATISEIAQPFPVSFNAVSKHVMVLERAGLIERKVQGRRHVCRLRPLPLRQASAWLEHYRKFWEVRFDALEKYVAVKAREAKTKENRGPVHGKLR